jgi:chitinase
LLPASTINRPGPNAPLSNGCNNSLQPLANAKDSVESWHKAGFPYNKIMLGTAFYGYISPSDSTKLYTKRGEPNTIEPAPKRSWGSRHGIDGLSSSTTGSHSELAKRAVTVKNEGGGSTDGQVMFVDLIRQGALAWDNAQRKWVGANGFTRIWDSCSSTVGPSRCLLSAVSCR